MIVQYEIYVVSFYADGVYVDSHDETFTAKRANDFCKSFNRIQRAQVAVAESHTLSVEPRERI